MKILITGSKGFLGRNLIEKINITISNVEFYFFDKNDSVDLLDIYCRDCDFVFNFAAVHRPLNEKEFLDVNFNQFSYILKKLEEYNNACPVLYTSSIQSNNGTTYGESKYLSEIALRKHSNKINSRCIIYRLTNIFGKWAKPNGHSVVATFCYNVINNIPLYVSDREKVMCFNYVDDVIDSFLERLAEGSKIRSSDNEIYEISNKKNIYITLGDLAEMISNFKEMTQKPSDYIEELFYKTYKSYEEYKTL